MDGLNPLVIPAVNAKRISILTVVLEVGGALVFSVGCGRNLSDVMDTVSNSFPDNFLVVVSHGACNVPAPV